MSSAVNILGGHQSDFADNLRKSGGSVESLVRDTVLATVADAQIDLTDIEATTASDYYEQLLDLPLLPIDNSSCADSPVVAEFVAVKGFVPVVFDGALGSLIVLEGTPDTAVIVGPTCEVDQS